jgi:hypothetical protein
MGFNKMGLDQELLPLKRSVRFSWVNLPAVTSACLRSLLYGENIDENNKDKVIGAFELRIINVGSNRLCAPPGNGCKESGYNISST